MSQTIVNTGDGYYFTVTVSVDAPSVRLTLDYTGMLNFQRWNSSTSSWTVFEKFPSPTCDRYAFCGPFGYCDSTEYVPTCKCLDGYEPNGLFPRMSEKGGAQMWPWREFLDLAHHEDS